MQASTSMVWLVVLLVLQSGLCSFGASTNASTRPEFVNIGGVFSVNTLIGKVAQVAILAAVEDVNSDPSVLGGTKLKLTIQDTNYSGFLGIVEGKSDVFSRNAYLCWYEVCKS